jgi:hypothetical protein
VIASAATETTNGALTAAASEAAMYQASTSDSHARPRQPPPRFPNSAKPEARSRSHSDAPSPSSETSRAADAPVSSTMTSSSEAPETPRSPANGWRLASDGNWYPSDAHTKTQAQDQSPLPVPPSPGPGWWLASDLNWYPPETALNGQPSAAAPPSPGPGWWLASDLNWYPPSSPPNQASPHREIRTRTHSAARLAAAPVSSAGC